MISGIPLVRANVTKNIKRYEQLFVDYGDEYWETRQ